MLDRVMPEDVTIDDYIEWCDYLTFRVTNDFFALYERLVIGSSSKMDILRANIAKWNLISCLADLRCAGCKEVDLHAGGDCAECLIQDECNMINEQSALMTYQMFRDTLQYGEDEGDDDAQ